MIDWDVVQTSVVSAAGTALVVTLVIEYFAKPRLEVRKERMLDMVRARKDLISSVVAVSLAAEMLLQRVPDDADAAVRDAFESERERHHARMRETCISLFDNAGRYVGAYPTTRVQSIVMDFITTLYAVMLSPRTQQRQAEIVRALARQLTAAVDPGRWWRIPAGALAMIELERLIASTREPAAEDIQARPDSSE